MWVCGQCKSQSKTTKKEGKSIIKAYNYIINDIFPSLGGDIDIHWRQGQGLRGKITVSKKEKLFDTEFLASIQKTIITELKA